MSPTVVVLMGSISDKPKIQNTLDTLAELGIPFAARVMSAHRTPARVAEFASGARADGVKVIIAAAGGAAHLAGVVAAHTTLPVIGIPVEGGALNGMDALLATVQMPGGIPVATVGIGRGGAQNAALLAAQIIALGDTEVAAAIDGFRKAKQSKVLAADVELQEALST